MPLLDPFAWNPPPPPTGSEPLVDVFLRLACLIYGDWHRSNPEKARRLLADHPDLAAASIYAAAALGDVAAVGAAIARDRDVVNVRGGLLQWEPLLYACYSRLDGIAPGLSTLEVARLLLANGADPNAGFLWDGTYAFTALTGAFGEGEDGINQPPHPQCQALATLLLDAGADPNDGQTLYNRHFNRNDDHLTLLLSYGLGADKGGPWIARLGDRGYSPARMLIEELWSAAKNGFLERVKLLVAHGVDVNVPGVRNGRTPYEEALRAGHGAIAEYLLGQGATKVQLDPVEAFALACIGGHRDQVRARLAEDPALLDKLGPHGRVDLIHRAVQANQSDGVRLIVELGVDVNEMIPGTGISCSPLHTAGRLEMVKLLLELGADPQLRDPSFNATPIAWANHGQQQHVVDYLMPSASIFDAVQCGGVQRVAELLQTDPSLASARDERDTPLVFYLHSELPRLDEMIETLIGHGVDLNVRTTAGETLLDRAIARGLTEFADALRAHGARTGTGA
jgi:ankyrin repeat protein